MKSLITGPIEMESVKILLKKIIFNKVLQKRKIWIYELERKKNSYWIKKTLYLWIKWWKLIINYWAWSNY